MLNKVILIGRLATEPELRYTSNGKAVTNFILAINRGYKVKNPEENNADFIRIVVWNKQAELCVNNLNKGRLVCIEGNIRTGQYEKNSQKIYTTDIQAVKVIFLDWKNKDNNDSITKEEENKNLRQNNDNEEVPF